MRILVILNPLLLPEFCRATMLAPQKRLIFGGELNEVTPESLGDILDKFCENCDRTNRRTVLLSCFTAIRLKQRSVNVARSAEPKTL